MLNRKEKLDKLYMDMGENISRMYPSLLNSINLYKLVSSSKVENEKKELWIDLLRLYYYVLFCNLDIVSTFRAELRAETVWEKRIHLKYLNVIQTETIKAMFGFGEDKHALWWKFCRDAGTDLSEYDKSEIERTLSRYKSEFFNNYSKDCRDFAIHYDDNPLKVYDYLTKISEQEEIDKVSGFFDLLKKLLHLIEKLSKEQGLPMGMPSMNGKSIWELWNVFPDKEHKLITKAKEELALYCKTLDSVVRSYRLPDIMEERVGMKGVSSQLLSLKETLHPGIHLLYIYIDISCALIAYLGAEYYIEKQLNLRHLNVVVYEGFKKLYGFPCGKEKDAGGEGGRSCVAFWRDIILPRIEKSGNIDWKRKAQMIECQLQILAIDSSINNNALRLMSIKMCNKKKVDYIPRFTDELVRMNPFQEMRKALLFMKVLPNVMELEKETMNIVYRQETELYEKNMDEMRNKLENVRVLILQSSKDEALKEKINDSINKVLSLTGSLQREQG